MTEFRSIRIDEEKCIGRMACMRICPTQAIRVRGCRATLLPEYCINCGECVRVCPKRAIVPLTSSFSDFSKFTYTIALPSPEFYSQFGREATPALILAALKNIGFNDSYDVACASESVSIGIQEYLDHVESPRPLISPFCPAVVRLVQIRYPSLLDNLIPIESPMEIAAREVKRLKMKELGLKENEIGVIFLTPCPAKMQAIKHPARKRHSWINGTIAISDIYPSVLQALPRVDASEVRSDIQGLGLGWPTLGGQVASLRAEDCLAIGGMVDVVRIFDDIEHGKMRNIQYIECHACPTGCVGGSLNIENSYIARGRVLSMVGKYGSRPCQDREKIRELYQKNFFSLPGKIPPVHQEPLDEEVAKAIQKLHQKQHLYERLPGIDCGACGSPTCHTFADDVVRGHAETDDCVFMAMQIFESLSSSLIKTVSRHSDKLPRQGEGGRV